MEWFEELYDDFRQRTGFGSLPPERTRRDVDFIVTECDLEPGDRVLDLCSGTGRHSIELESRGIHAVGVELNPRYVALARSRADQAGVHPIFRTGDVRTVELGSGFDAAILMWNSFGYFPDSEDLDVLRRVRAALRPGGRFILEVLNRDFILENFEAVSDRDIQGIRVVEERRFHVPTRRMRSIITRYEAGQVQIRRTDWRLYSLDELESLGASVGFRLAAAYGDLDRNPVTSRARLMKLVLSNVEAAG